MSRPGETSHGWQAIPLPRSQGLLLHLGGILLCALAIGFMLTAVTAAQAGLAMILLLLAALAAGLLLAILLYRLYGLWRAAYWLSRAGLRLQWGARRVDLPHEAILDLAAAADLEAPPAPPRWTWPGSVVGRRQDPELGEVEFLAAQTQNLVFIGTTQGVYAISPRDPGAFLAAYRDFAERGSLQSLPTRSISPSSALGSAWGDAGLRRLLIGGALLATGLLVLVGATAPGRGNVPLGFAPDGQPLPELPGAALFLLPALNLLFFVGNLFMGLLLYAGPARNEFTRLLWGGSLATGLLFLLAILILL